MCSALFRAQSWPRHSQSVFKKLRAPTLMADVPSGDLVGDFRQVAQEVQDEYDRSGVASACSIAEALDGTVKNLRLARHEAVDLQTAALIEFRSVLQTSREEPETSFTSGSAGALNLCNYGKAVALKIGGIIAEVDDIIHCSSELGYLVVGSMASLEDEVVQDVETLQQTLCKLARLPREVAKIAAEIRDADDIAVLDVSTLRGYTDIKNSPAAVDRLMGAKDTLSRALTQVSSLAAKTDDFLERMPDMLRDVFEVPCLCCLSQRATAIMSTLRASADKLSTVLLHPLVAVIQSAVDMLALVDARKLSEPMVAFNVVASRLLDKLDKLIEYAKLVQADEKIVHFRRFRRWRALHGGA
mmetsp:Transcript_50413/g.141056  ORF Transcript_50413/g.141056 Transcript_50413/m.141056 type:complete len:357 (+) Transcript_50413:31-1101(+)